MIELSLVPSKERSLRKGLRRNTIEWVVPQGKTPQQSFPVCEKEMPKEFSPKVKESLFNNGNHQ